METVARDGRVRVVIVGDELLNGRTKDANGGWLAERLDDLGYVVRRITVIPDEDDVLTHEVDASLTEAATVIVSGGLGPTHDDRTTRALAAHYGRALVVDDAGWKRLEARYAKRFMGATPPADMVESARKMVTIPEGATSLPNPVGAATGYVLADARGRVIVLPGVPRELVAMFDEAVAGVVLPARSRSTTVELDVALPEAGFARALEDVSTAFPDVAIGSYPKATELRVTLRFRGVDARAREAREAARARLGAEHVMDERG